MMPMARAKVKTPLLALKVPIAAQALANRSVPCLKKLRGNPPR